MSYQFHCDVCKKASTIHLIVRVLRERETSFEVCRVCAQRVEKALFIGVETRALGTVDGLVVEAVDE